MGRITHVGSMPIAEIGERCRRMAYVLAQAAQPDIIAGDPELVEKDAYDGTPGADFSLKPDRNTQERLLELLAEMLREGVGCLAEEDDLYIPCTLPGPSVLVVVDPIDGTHECLEAVRNKRLPGRWKVAVMISLVVDGVSIATFVCDVTTLEMYVRMPYEELTWWIDGEGMQWIPTASLRRTELKLLWHASLVQTPRDVASPLASELIDYFRCFGQVERPGSSIGLCAAQVLCGNATALIRSALGTTTPWDDAPLEAWSNCRGAGFVTLWIMEDRFVETATPLDKKRKHKYDLLYIDERFLYLLTRFARVERLVPVG